MRLIRSSDSAAGTPLPEIQAAMRAVSEKHLREWVKTISIPRHFQEQRAHNEATALWVAKQLNYCGYNVQLQGSYRNVVALPKQRSSDEMMLLGAHYDSVSGTPGADDNGSAIAALLGCANVLAKFAPQTPVAFVAFNCEEDGMVGSADFANNYLPTVDFKISEAHILEMVGFTNYNSDSQKLPTGLPIDFPHRGDFLGLLANQNSGVMMDSILFQAKTYLPQFNVLGLEVGVGAERAFPVLARSDHVAFWDRRIPAVMWSDTAEFRNPNYHNTTDTPETLDYAFLGLVTQLLVAYLGTRQNIAPRRKTH